MFYFRYSRWDGSQNLPDFDADEALADMADDILGYGDLQSALQRMMQQGMRPQNGPPMRGPQGPPRPAQAAPPAADEPLRSRLEPRRHKAEARAGHAEGARGHAASARRQGARAPRGEAATDPPDAAGRLRDLQKHDFASAEAKQIVRRSAEVAERADDAALHAGHAAVAAGDDPGRPQAHAGDDPGPQPDDARRRRWPGA